MDLLYGNERKGAYPPSAYAAGVDLPPPLPALDGERRTEICVVGGGYTGLSAALHLAEQGREVTLIDAQRVGWGASGRNGGQMGTGQRLDQITLEGMVGLDHARRLWDIAEGAKALVQDRISRHKIDCEFAPGIIYADHKKRYVSGTREYVDHLRAKYGYDKISFLDRDALSAAIGTDVYHAGSLDWGAGHLNPLKFALGLASAAQAAGVTIFEETRAMDITRGDTARVKTASGTITADHVLLACNGYLGTLEPDVANRVMPINSYIAATEPLDEARAKALIPANVAIADSRFVVNYYRLSADRRMLFGGREAYGYRHPADIAKAVRQRMLSIYPQLSDLRMDYDWGGTLGITMNRMPHFARLAPNMLSASGFSGHGLAMATMAGALMAEALSDRPERFDTIASVPTHRFPGGTALRRPLLVMAMLYYALRDRF